MTESNLAINLSPRLLPAVIAFEHWGMGDHEATENDQHDDSDYISHEIATTNGLYYLYSEAAPGLVEAIGIDAFIGLGREFNRVGRFDSRINKTMELRRQGVDSVLTHDLRMSLIAREFEQQGVFAQFGLDPYEVYGRIFLHDCGEVLSGIAKPNGIIVDFEPGFSGGADKDDAIELAAGVTLLQRYGVSADLQETYVTSHAVAKITTFPQIITELANPRNQLVSALSPALRAIMIKNAVNAPCDTAAWFVKFLDKLEGDSHFYYYSKKQNHLRPRELGKTGLAKLISFTKNIEEESSVANIALAQTPYSIPLEEVVGIAPTVREMADYFSKVQKQLHKNHFWMS